MAFTLQNNSKVTLSQAHHYIADLIANGNYEYLPIFERLENELQFEQQRTALLKRAHQVSSSKKPTLDNQTAF